MNLNFSGETDTKNEKDSNGKKKRSKKKVGSLLNRAQKPDDIRWISAVRISGFQLRYLLPETDLGDYRLLLEHSSATRLSLLLPLYISIYLSYINHPIFESI